MSRDVVVVLLKISQVSCVSSDGKMCSDGTGPASFKSNSLIVSSSNKSPFTASKINFLVSTRFLSLLQVRHGFCEFQAVKAIAIPCCRKHRFGGEGVWVWRRQLPPPPSQIPNQLEVWKRSYLLPKLETSLGFGCAPPPNLKEAKKTIKMKNDLQNNLKTQARRSFTK